MSEKSESVSSLVTAADVFISSPSDVAEERYAIIRCIELINRLPHVRENYVLRPFRYEDIPPGAGEEPQLIVDRACDVAKCNFVICVLWKRMGTPFTHPASGKRYNSGTEYEFITAYEARISSNGLRPELLVYRKIADKEQQSENEIEQQKLVENFFYQFEGEGADFRGLYSAFDQVDEFEKRVFVNLLDLLYRKPPALHPEILMPKIVEEERRLDVAAPEKAGIDDVIEVWAKICLPDAKGLQGELPDLPEAPGAPTKSDAKEKFMAVAYQRGESSNDLLPLPMEIEIVSSDFEVLENRRRIELIKGKDSPTIVFLINATTNRTTGVLQVRVKTKSFHSDYWIENSSMACRINLSPSSFPCTLGGRIVNSTGAINFSKSTSENMLGEAARKDQETKSQQEKQYESMRKEPSKEYLGKTNQVFPAEEQVEIPVESPLFDFERNHPKYLGNRHGYCKYKLFVIAIFVVIVLLLLIIILI